MKKEISVIGHKNPDTDSICSSIAYANLKNIITSSNVYFPKRIGELNSETLFVLNYFKAEEPMLIDNLRTQVKDINIRKVELVKPEISLKKAWEIMKSNGITTLAVSHNNRTLDGIMM